MMTSRKKGKGLVGGVMREEEGGRGLGVDFLKW